MAKRKRKSGRTTRRRRVGAINANNPLVKYGSVAAGYFLSDKINEQLEKVTGDKVDGKILAAAEAGLGLMLMLNKKMAKKPIVKILGGVLAGAGVKKALTEFGVINGFQDVPVLAGYKSVPVLNGYTTAPVAINGFTVPRPVHQSVMGGIGEDGSGINAADR